MNMKKSLFVLFFFIMLLFFFPGLLPAQESGKKGYVSDMLWLSLREGPGNTFRSMRSLKSNTPVMVLEEKEKFFRIKLESGQEGWVDRRFINFDTPKALIIAKLKKTNEQLEKKIREMEAKPVQVIKAMKTQTDAAKEFAAKKFIKETVTLMKAAMDANSDKKLLFSDDKEEYKPMTEQIGKIRQIVMENKSLHKKNKSLSEKLASAKSESTKVSETPLFFKSDMIKWAFFGVGVLVLGWIFGHSISIRRRRRSSSLLD